MPRKKCSNEQIIHALRSVEAGTKIGDVCRQLGVASRHIIAERSSMPGSASASCGG